MPNILYEQFYQNISKIIHSKINAVALAVSGGSDSVSMLFLARIWALESNIKLVVMSVDHNLRSESKQESEYIKKLACRFGLEYYQLFFDHENKFSNIQARARDARYRLMTELCKKLDILVILTAHHQDDYVENYCMRLDKKSSAFGLSSSNTIWLNNIMIVRPLFNVSKKSLIDYLVVNNIKWYEDLSNESDKYTRNIFRKEIFAGINYDKKKIIERISLSNLEVLEELRPQLVEAIAESIKIYKFGFATINLLKFLNFSQKIQLQAFSYTLLVISGSVRAPRTRSLDALVSLLSLSDNFTKTLHGCVIKKAQNHLVICREFGINAPVDIKMDCVTTWDNRFKSEKIARGYYISHLTMQNYKEIRKDIDISSLKSLSFGQHFSILSTLPVVKCLKNSPDTLEKLVAISHISYYDTHVLSTEFNISFAPNFISRFTHFS